jgi:membrane-associated phospholipid phosphatase
MTLDRHQFYAVRDNPHFVWSLKESAGIMTFPSVHAAVAVLCAWSAWDLKALRYPVLALNIAMALSAVPSASHYLIDVVAGLGVAAFSIASVVLLTKEACPKTKPAFAA